MASTDALPIPRKNVAFRHYFAMYKSDGTIITNWTGVAGLISKDGAATASLTNTPTEIGTFGRGYIDLTSGEMNADAVVFSVTITNVGAVALTVVLFPMEDVDIRANVVDWNGTAVATPTTSGYVMTDMAQALPSAPTANSVGEALFLADILGGRFGTAQAGAFSTITLDSGANSTDSAYVGFGIFLYGGTGGGIRGTGQFRTITVYNGTTKVATVDRAWGTNPDNTSKFMLLPRVAENVILWNGHVVPTEDTSGYPKVTVKSGTGTGEISLASGLVDLTQTAADKVWSTTVRILTTYSDSLGVTTLLSRLSSGRALLLDNLDAAITGIPTAVWANGTRTLSSFGTLVADIWANGTRTLTAISDSSGVTTLLSRLTSGRALLLDNLDGTITGIPAAVWASATRTLSAISDSAGITTLLTRIASALTITGGKVEANNVAEIQSGLATSAGVTSATSPLLTTSHFDASVVAVDLTPITNQLDIMQADTDLIPAVKAKTDLITADNFTLTSPNIPGTSNIQLVEENDYTLTSGLALPTWTSSDWTVFDLTNADSVTFETKTEGTAYTLTKNAIVNSDTSVSVELTRDNLSHFGPTLSVAQILTWDKPVHTFSLKAVLASGDHVTLAQGRMFIIEDVQ